MRKRVIGVTCYLVFLAIGLLFGPVGSMPIAGFRVIMLLIGTIILWVTEAIPSPVVGFLFMVLVPAMGIQTFTDACAAFFNSSVLFVLASYGVAVALLKTNLLKRCLKHLLKSCGRSPDKTIYAFSLSTAILSSICSDIPSVLLFNGLAMDFLGVLGEKPGRSSYGRALLLSITFAALIGGIATPAGSAINIMALQILENQTGFTCFFLLWSVFGIPSALLLTLASCWVCTKIHRSAEFEKDAIDILNEIVDIPEKLDRQEKGVAIVIVIMLVGWISTTWLPQINIAMVSVAGMIILMFPGVDLLTWKEYQEGTSWNSVLSMGGVMVIASAVSSTGVAVWLVEEAMVVIDFSALPLFLLFLIVAVFVGLMHIPVPAGPALMGVVVLPCITISEAVGIDPVLLTMTCAMLGSCAIMPFDPVVLITYGEGYYSIKDQVKCGVPILLAWSALIAAVMSIASFVI